MLKFILGLFSGPISEISNDLREAYQSKLKAENDKEKVAADERINLLEARKSIILAAQSNPGERIVRILFAVPFVIYVNKLVVYDKVLGWGSTDPLSSDLTQLLWIVIGGYFIDYTVRGTARIIKK